MLQFRKEKNLKTKIIRDTDPELLNFQVENFGEEYVFEDLQYSSTTLPDGKVEYSVFIIYRSI